MLLCALLLAGAAQTLQAQDYRAKADSVLRLMTLEEKIGQLVQYSNDRNQTGPEIPNAGYVAEIRHGRVGSILNVVTPERARQYQEEALKSRLRIPLLFGLDVIHGMRTIFPIPLGEAASFDLELMRRTASCAAAEASAHGVHWTFAPMVDVGRDARWGRVMEGAGEDTWYGCRVAEARVRGFQGDGYADKRTILACAKHFAAYGAALAGRDYAETDLSERSLHEVYLPPFRAAVDAGVATFMHGFNDLNGEPVAASRYLQTDILRNDWGFTGFVVSDWGSVGQLVPHRYVRDKKEAAEKALLAGCDMDMCSGAYIENLQRLVEQGRVGEAVIDEAARRILIKKFELGLFDDPFCYNRRADELKDEKIRAAHRALAREAAAKSMVLLKNRDNALPLKAGIRKIALVGPLARSQWDMLGNWSAQGRGDEVVTIETGLRAALPEAEITYVEGYDLKTNELRELPALGAFDAIIAVVGERGTQSGEAKSKTDITLDSRQQQLVRQLKERSGKPVAVLLMGGRPQVFGDMEPYADAILVGWWPGSEAGNAVADVLTGRWNPSGKLPMTFPRRTGQCPLYYNTKSTGRPYQRGNQWTSGYIDTEPLPAYPFGYGLSYTTFEIGTPELSQQKYNMADTIRLRTTVKNTGSRPGRETVQLYLQDVVSSLTRPVKELCGFRQVELQPGEEQEVVFTLTSRDLAFCNAALEFVTEPGEFLLFTGPDSEHLQAVAFELTE